MYIKCLRFDQMFRLFVFDESVFPRILKCPIDISEISKFMRVLSQLSCTHSKLTAKTHGKCTD